MKRFLNWLGSVLQKISNWRDEVLYLFIKPYWPRKITPNHLSYLRIVIGLVLFVLLFVFGLTNKTLIISLFCIGIATDLLDGSIARGLNKVSELGATLDPIADRFLILPIAIYSLYKIHWILLIVWFLTEIVNALTSTFYKKKKAYTESNIFGKTKMVLWCVVFLAILIIWPRALPVLFVDIIWISLIISFLSIFTKFLELKKEGHIVSKFINKEFSIKIKNDNKDL